MQRHAVPNDNEKKAWPKASRNTVLLTLEKSGLSRKSTPRHAPGSMHDAPTSTISRINRVGMSRLDTFSMPLRMPCTTTKWVIRMNATAQNAGITGLWVKSLK